MPFERLAAGIVRLAPGRWRFIGLTAAIALACVLPFLLSNYQIFQLTLIVIYSIALLGLNLLTGFNGQISLGHGAFFALGAYCSAILIAHVGLPYLASIPISGFVCFIAGFLFGLPALRLEGPYLALATFGLAVATPQILKFQKLQFLTGGTQGILIDKPEPPALIPLNADRWLYLLSLAVMAALFFGAWNILRGRTGRAMVAIRDHPLAASAMGIDLQIYKTLTFAVSAMYTGVAGALSMLVTQYVAPDSFTIFFSISLIVGSVIGGITSISGAILGAAFIVIVPNIADTISKAAPWALYGIILIGCMYLMPEGIVSLLEVLRDVLYRRRDRAINFRATRSRKSPNLSVASADQGVICANTSSAPNGPSVRK